MRSSFLLTIIMTALVISAHAQTPTGKISGQVGESGNPLQTAVQAATISLLKARDSAVVKIAVTDKSGHYEFGNVVTGQYLLQVSAIGHVKQFTPVFEVTGQGVEIAPVALEKESKEMKAVTVTAGRPMIEQKIDKTVVNVEASVTNVGANALEVLEKAPGVQVDKDGNISLKGKQGVTIMMDGRPTYLNGAELANLLKGMQASQLDQIEIMTNPPAKYDASGNSGVINIRTRKNKMKGFNGSVTAGYGQGVYAKTNESLSLNYRNGKVNLFSNYSFSRNENFQQLDIYRRFKNEDGSTNSIFEQVAFMKRVFTNNNLKLGMDYFLTSKTVLGIVVNGAYNPEINDNHNVNYLKNASSAIDSINTATGHKKEIWKTGSVNLNMRHQFDSTGRELTADIDYIRYSVSNDQQFVNSTFDPYWAKKNDKLLNGDLPVTINIYAAKLDYTQPLNKGAKLEMGIKSSYVNTVNKANYVGWNGSAWTPDYGKTNFFDYKENVNAAYISLNKQLNKKWGIQAGLRFENTSLRGLQYGNPTKKDSSFKRDYNNLFPTVYVSYKASDAHQFGVSMGRRIDRPSYEDLNPFLYFIDAYTYEQGNTFLRPQYSNNFEVSHIFKSFLTTTLNYSQTKDLFNETFVQGMNADSTSNNSTIVSKGNIGRRRNMGISVSAQIQVTKWWMAMVYTNYNYTHFTGELNNSAKKEYIDVEAGNLMVNLNNQFKFAKGWSGELSGWYRTKGVEGQILLNAFGQMSAGIAKQVLKEKGSIKLGVRDIFYTQQPSGSMSFQSTEARFKNYRDSRVVNVTFTYRFGKPLKNMSGQRKKGGAGEEQSRVKGGGE